MNDAIPFNVASAQQAAQIGKLEEWVHAYLNTGHWANPALSEGLKLQKRWWRGPLELPLTEIHRCVGPEPGMEYLVSEVYWEGRIQPMADSILAAGLTAYDLPPFIVEYGKEFSIRDGNHRCGAFERLGWKTAWVLIWYDRESDYLTDCERGKK